jgi:hypothetical protein
LLSVFFSRFFSSFSVKCSVLCANSRLTLRNRRHDHECDLGGRMHDRQWQCAGSQCDCGRRGRGGWWFRGTG